MTAAPLALAFYLILASADLSREREGAVEDPRPAAARPAGADCLTCHGEKGFRDRSGRNLQVEAAKHKASVHGSLACQDCHTDIHDYPHPRRPQRMECATCHAEPAAAIPKSVHGLLGQQACASCHGHAHEVRPPAQARPQPCSACHGDAARQYELSVHASVRNGGNQEGATCSSCHGPAHGILAAHDPVSPVAKKNLPNTCGACHSNPEFLARHNIPYAHPVEAYRLSVHGRAVTAGNRAVASCSDCHSNHAIFSAGDPRSKIHQRNVPNTCGACHTEIEKTYLASIHGQAFLAGAHDAPVCTSCHGEHAILAPSEPRSMVNPARVSTVTCGRCHGDERLTQRYNLPPDRLPTYEASYHGLAQKAGTLTVANCASCHGVHNIFPSRDSRSTVHPANLARTCGHCHPGAGQAFAIGPVHVSPVSAAEHPVVRWIRLAYWVLIPLTLAFMVFHNLADFLAKLVRGGARRLTGEAVPRMNLHFRVTHGLVMLSFPVLVITGFALKFPTSWWAQPIVQWENRFAFRGTLHRVAAVALIASMAYHAVHLIVSRRDRIILHYLRPAFEDLRNLVETFRYNLALSSQRPRFGKFSYGEKIEYFAFFWGMLVMTLSGFLLWFDNFTLRHFPKWVADAATALHYYEAILATLSILAWHFYATMFDPDVYPMDLSWLTGKTSAEHLRHTRPAYYEALRRAEESPAHPGPAGPPKKGSETRPGE